MPGRELINMLTDMLTVNNPKENPAQFQRYSYACELARTMLQEGKFSKINITNIDLKENWHTIEADIDDDTVFDGKEVEVFADFIRQFDYVVFEPSHGGKTHINCSTENVYIDGDS